LKRKNKDPEVEKSPTSTGLVISQWHFPTNAYTSDNAYAVGGEDDAQQDYGDYGLDIPSGSIIDQVLVRVEHKEEGGFWQIYITVSWDGGTTWGTLHEVPIALTERIDEVDVSADTDWTPQKLSNANFKVLAYANEVGTGCYHIDSEFMLAGGVLMKAKKLIEKWKKKERIVLLGWNRLNDKIVEAEVKRIKVHIRRPPQEPFEFVRIYAKIPEYAFKGGQLLDIAVTPEHPVWERRRGSIRADEIKIGDFLSGLFKAEDGSWKFEPCRVVKIERFKDWACLNIEADCDFLFYHYMLEVVIK